MPPEPEDLTQQPEKPDTGVNSGTLTQEQVNAIVTERVKRAEEAALKKHYEALGVKDAEELKALVTAKKEADDKAKTELEKAAEKATTAEAKLKQLEAEHASQLAAMQKRILDSDIKSLAGRSITDKDGKVTRAAFRVEALEDILLLIDRAGIEDKDGKFEGIDKALEALAKSKPYLLADGQTVTQPKGTPRPGEKKPAPQQQQAPAAPAWTL